MLALVGQQLATQVDDLRANVVEGISQVQDWARTGPLGPQRRPAAELDRRGQGGHLHQRHARCSPASPRSAPRSPTSSPGFFIALFAAFFFLYEGDRIWSWVVALFPRASRERVNSSGQTAWRSLTAFVRATVVVALTDAMGIAFAAWALGVPLTLAIGVLVFLGAFVPIIGALISGMVAVLVALVAQGPWTALFMLLAVDRGAAARVARAAAVPDGRARRRPPAGDHHRDRRRRRRGRHRRRAHRGAAGGLPQRRRPAPRVDRARSSRRTRRSSLLNRNRPRLVSGVDLSDVDAARSVLEGVIEETPSLHSRWLSTRVGTPVYLKCENLQRAGSFKIRGGYLRISRLSPDERARGVVAASAGNHAQGVALAASMLDTKATIFMPEGAALPKVAATQGYGAEVEFSGTGVTEALVAAQEFAERTGAVLIHPFDHPDIVAGQGTVGLEIIEQVPDVQTIVVPLGGGGLAAGIALLRERHPRRAHRRACRPRTPRPIPARSPKGIRSTAVMGPTMADGIAVARPGDIPFEIVATQLDEVITVSEESMSQALLGLLERGKMLVEPSGAAGVAALLDRPDAFEGPVVSVLSGGNIDAAAAARRHPARPRGRRSLHPPAGAHLRPAGRADAPPDRPREPAGQRHQRHPRPLRGGIGVREVDVAIEGATRGPDHRDEVRQRRAWHAEIGHAVRSETHVGESRRITPERLGVDDLDRDGLAVGRLVGGRRRRPSCRGWPRPSGEVGE